MHATDAGLIQQPQKLPEAGDMWVTMLVIYNPLELFGFFPCMYVSSSFLETTQMILIDILVVRVYKWLCVYCVPQI
jgi:hypothetical protein